MARPSPDERAGIEARRAMYAKQREEAAAAKEAIRVKVQALADAALVEDLGQPATPEEIRSMLRRAFAGAMQTEQWGHAEKCAMSLAKFDGLYVERSQSAVAIGSPEEFRGEDEEDVYRRVAERVGDERAREFRQFIEGQNRRREPLALEDQSDDDES
jgi:hypothetical protein